MPGAKAIIKRGDDVAWQVVGDAVIAVTPATRKIHILSGCGTAIWGYLDTPRKLSELAAFVLDQFDVGQEAAERDIGLFIKDLLEKNILICEGA
jgi:hypothetical protein